MCAPPPARFLSELICLENFAKASVQLVECLADLLTTFDLGVTVISFPSQGRREKLDLARLMSRELFSGENLGFWQCVWGLMFKRANMWGQKRGHSSQLSSSAFFLSWTRGEQREGVRKENIPDTDT